MRNILKLIIFTLLMLAGAGLANGQAVVSFGATRAQDTSKTLAQVRLTAYSGADTGVLITTANGTVKRIALDSLFYYVPSPIVAGYGIDITGNVVAVDTNTLNAKYVRAYDPGRSVVLNDLTLTQFLDVYTTARLHASVQMEGIPSYEGNIMTIDPLGVVGKSVFGTNELFRQGGDNRNDDTLGSLSKIYLRPKNTTKVLIDSIGLNAQNLYVGDLTQLYRRGQIGTYTGAFGMDSTNPVYNVGPFIATARVGFTSAPNPGYFLHGGEFTVAVKSDNTQIWGDAAAHDAIEGVRINISSEANAAGFTPRATGLQVATGFSGTGTWRVGELTGLDVSINHNFKINKYYGLAVRDFDGIPSDSTAIGLLFTNGDKAGIESHKHYGIYDNIGLVHYLRGRTIIREQDSLDDGENLLQVGGGAIFDTVKIRVMATGAGSDNIVVWDGVRLKIESSANSLIKWSDTTSILATQFDISTKWDIAGNSLNVAGTDKIGSTNSAAWTAVVNNVPVVSFNTTRTTQFGSNVLQSATNGAVIVARDSNTVTGSNILIQNPSTGTNTGSDGLRLTMLGLNGSLVNRENGTLSLGANNTVSTTILANGNVGIGTVSPASPLSVIGNASVGANLSATDFQWSPLGNERQLIFTGANGSNGYGDMLLGSNNTAANGQTLGYLLWGQTESGKSGSASGLKAAIGAVSSGSGGSVGGFGGEIRFFTRPDNNTSDPTAFRRMSITNSGDVNIGSATQFTVNSSGVITKYNNAIPANGSALIGNGTNFASTPVNDVSVTVIVATGGLTLTSPVTIREVDATTGNITITVTPSYAGQIFSFVRNDASGNTITIQMASGNIQGGASYNIANVAATAVPFVWNGTKAYICY